MAVLWVLGGGCTGMGDCENSCAMDGGASVDCPVGPGMGPGVGWAMLMVCGFNLRFLKISLAAISRLSP